MSYAALAEKLDLQRSSEPLFPLGFHSTSTVSHMRKCICDPEECGDFTQPGHGRNMWMTRKNPAQSFVRPKTPVLSQTSHQPADLSYIPPPAALLFTEHLSVNRLKNPPVRELCFTALSRESHAEQTTTKTCSENTKQRLLNSGECQQTARAY